MKKFLVPIDFSDTSKNAAKYAAQMLNGKADTQLILYYVYDSVTAGADGSILTEDDNDRKIVLDTAFEHVKEELNALSDVTVTYVAEQGDTLVENVDRYARHHDIDLIIMGITGATKLEQVFIGSNTLKLAAEGNVPVMIIPPDANFTEIKEVGITCDFKDVATTIPVEPIRKLLRIFNPKLYIINVDVEHYVDLTPEYKAEKEKVDEYFAEFNPEYAFIRMYDFIEAIDTFAKDKEIDFIITIPKKHGFLGSLFKSSTTKKLAYHSHIPIVAIHE